MLAKLRICTQHFSEDMIMPYASTRRLKENAVPVLLLPIDMVQNIDQFAPIMSLENVENESNFVHQMEIVHTDEREDRRYWNNGENKYRGRSS